ncbi:CCA tRNA nucleotidyltransferase [Agromyces humi]|uniref:CCA tRNA nucleotidyltransferase n=1 Tax=Agromyces humi TaxID=1766800 RepID=UPI001939572E|nr:HDIG domain-containing metalloprotein [Agromyces humi]
MMLHADEQVTCPNCGTSRERGAAHRCAAPDLLELSAATQQVIAACSAAGGTPLIVGGAVRDALRAPGTQPKDVDIEVHGLTGFDELRDELAATGAKVDLTGVSFGVLKTVLDGEDFDVSLPRRDSKVGDGHRGFTVDVDPTLDEVDAFARRDFTINAIGYDPTTGEVVDPFGGMADLEAGILRHTSDAFSEDPLRVLRAAQFCARMGLTLDEDTARLAESISDTFDELATERVWQEFRKLARAGTSITAALDVLERTGWLRHFPALAATRGCVQDAHWHPEGDVFTHLGQAADAAAAAAAAAGLEPAARERVVLAALCHDLGKPDTTRVHDDGKVTSYEHEDVGSVIARDFLRSIGAPADVAEHVGIIVREHMVVAGTGGKAPSKRAVRGLLRRLGDVPVAEWAAVVAADHAGRGTASGSSPADAWLALVDQLGPAAAPPRLVRGEHLIARGLRPGPAFKDILAASLDAQDSDVFDDEAGAVRWLDGYLAAANG